MTGLVTVSPRDGFAGGDITLEVGVRPGEGVTGNSPGDSDTQSITLRFEGEAIEAPTSLNLVAASDSGSSTNDNVTNATTHTFAVSGVEPNATVEIVDVISGTTLAMLTAPSQVDGPIRITTTNVAALGDGTYNLAARQLVDGDSSDLSPTLTMVLDTEAPAPVVSTAATQANVGREFSTDLISSEEGTGLVYELVSGPSTATLDPQTGVISWTPTADEIGENTLRFDKPIWRATRAKKTSWYQLLGSRLQKFDSN